jgi:type II secretion system protein C
MKQQLWVINSSLLGIGIISGIIFFMLQSELARPVKIRIIQAGQLAEKSVASINIAFIYENDLFDTYTAPEEKSPLQAISIPTAPTPPSDVLPQIPATKIPAFIEPLNVILKGVIYINDDPMSSIAIIQDGVSKAEQSYKMGDMVDDAQIIKIYPHNVSVVRSNGQQEMLYLRDEDAAKDLRYEANTILDEIVYARPHEQNVYEIAVPMFIQKIQSLGQLLDALEIATVYKQGTSIGMRVGRVEKDSLAQELGFKVDDIIVQVQNLPVDSVENRMKAYESVIALPIGSTITVAIERAGKDMNIQYVLCNEIQLKEKKTKEAAPEKSVISQQSVNELQEKRKELLKKRYNFAPTVKQIEKQERQNMLKNKQNRISKGMPKKNKKAE